MNEQPPSQSIKARIEYNCYPDIIKIMVNYLGKESDQFLSRQMSLYLKKDPKYLKMADIPMLAIRIRSGMLVLKGDHNLADEVFRRIDAICDENHSR